jgi:dipeptidyl aminopeptidase/acylaminoacyl peptidase
MFRHPSFLASVFVVLLVGCSPAEPPTSSSAPETTATRYSAREFFETTSYSLSGARSWSADGTRLLLASDETGIFNPFALSIDDGQRQALTASIETPQWPLSWFPEDDRILILADNQGDELSHVYVRELDGSIRDLTPGDNLQALFVGWSDDLHHFFVFTNERDPGAYDLYRYAALDYSRDLVFKNEQVWLPEALSRNGRHLVLMRKNSSADDDLFLVNVDGSGETPRHLTPHEGNISYRAFTFTRDGSQLVFGTNEHSEFMQAWTYDLATGETAPLIAADWDVSFVSFSDSGRYRVHGINKDARTAVIIEDAETEEQIELPGLPDGDLAQVRFSPDEKTIALMVSTDAAPRDVYLVDRNARSSQRLTNAVNPAIDEAQLIATEVVRYRSYDGLEVPGILYRPTQASAASPVPALVWVHGGPGGQSRRGYNPTLQHLANHGYAVLAANNRGSSGYGKTFFHMDDQKHGEVDLDDIVYAQKYLAGFDWIDGERIGIIGRSYGGYMVGAALAFRPEVFKVGINIFGVMNWLRTLESIPPWWEADRKALYDEMGDPSTDAERLRKISPLFHAENINVPFLVVQGANDPRVLQVESDEIVAAVRKNEVPVEYIVFEDEGHGFAQRANRITASDAYVRFLDKYL